MDAMVQQRGDNAESLSKTRYHQKNKQQAKIILLVRTYLYTKNRDRCSRLGSHMEIPRGKKLNKKQWVSKVAAKILPMETVMVYRELWDTPH